MTNLQGNLKKTLGDLWVKNMGGFRQCKQELGWTDYRFTNLNILKSGGRLFFAFTMISLNSQLFFAINHQVKTEGTKK